MKSDDDDNNKQNKVKYSNQKVWDSELENKDSDEQSMGGTFFNVFVVGPKLNYSY